MGAQEEVAAFLQAARDRCALPAKAGAKPKHEPGTYGKGECQDEHVLVGSKVERNGHGERHSHARAQPHQPPGHRKSDRARGHREQHALRKQLAKPAGHGLRQPRDEPQSPCGGLAARANIMFATLAQAISMINAAMMLKNDVEKRQVLFPQGKQSASFDKKYPPMFLPAVSGNSVALELLRGLHPVSASARAIGYRVSSRPATEKHRHVAALDRIVR